MSEQQRMQLERQDRLEAKLEAQRRESEAKLEEQRREIGRLCKPQMARDVISEAQLEAVQLRLEALHEARLCNGAGRGEGDEDDLGREEGGERQDACSAAEA